MQQDEAQQFADFYQMPYIECSSVSGEHVARAFEQLGERVLERLREGVYDPDGGWEGVRRGFIAAPTPAAAEVTSARKCC